MSFWSIFSQPQIPEFPLGTTFAGRTVLITGASSGIGYAAALQVLKLGVSKLIITVRSAKKGEETKKALLAHSFVHESVVIDPLVLDLRSFGSVHSFVDGLKKRYDHIDHAFLNAAMSVMAWEMTKDGHESNVQVNYLSNVLLAFHLLPLLRSPSPIDSPSHLSFVGSLIDENSTLTKSTSDDDLRHPISYLKEKRSWNKLTRYPDTKLLLFMFVRQMAKHAKAPGRDCIINAACPGFTSQTGFDSDTVWYVRWVTKFFRSITGRPLDAAARTIIFAGSLASEDTRGELLISNKIRPPISIVNTPKGVLLEESLWKDTVKFVEQENPGSLEYL